MSSLDVLFKETVGTFHLDVSFHVERGEVVGLLGRSGNGKSLTLRTIAGIQRPTEGSISIDGRYLFDSSRKIDLPVRERNVGYLFQSYALFPRMTVIQNVMCGIREKDRGKRREKGMSMLSLLQMEGYASRFPGQLSGGQQQRVALARMLASGPDILMLDEPFSALDQESKAEIDEKLIGLLHSFGGPVVFVSHDPDEVARYCTRTLSIADGYLHQGT